MQLAQSAQDMIDLQLPGGSPTPTGVTPATLPTPEVWSQIANLIPAGLTAYQQIKLQNLQMNLIKQGRPPLTPQQIAAMAPQLNIGIASGTQTMLMYGGAAVLALIVLSQLGKRRRA